MVNAESDESVRTVVAWVRVVLLGAFLAALTGAAISLPLIPTGRVVLEDGEVASQDVRAPRSVTYESAILRAEEQARAASQVEPAFTTPDPALARQQIDRARNVVDYLVSVRSDALASRTQQREWVLAVPELSDLPRPLVDSVLGMADDSWNRVQLDVLAVIDQAMRRETRDDNLADARAEVSTLASFDLSDEEASATVALAQRFLVPSSFLDAEATANARAQAREQVPIVLRTFEAGQVIVREGERVTALDIEALNELGLRQRQVQWADLVGAVLFAILATATTFLYLARFQRSALWDVQQCLLLILLLAVGVIGSAVMVPGGLVLRYLFPAAALSMLAAAALGPHAGVATAAFVGGVSGVVGNAALDVAAYTTVSGTVAALTLGRVRRIGDVFRAATYAALVHVAIVLIFVLPGGTVDASDLAVSSLSGVLNAGISASLALGGLFVIGPVFDIATTLRLIELSRPDHPLLSRLMREAPATYHHSLMVANLAEQAAERIGADPLLARVGAYYHDVGKLTRPVFFAENQVSGVNPHSNLDAYTSAQVIIDHVRDGIELARTHRLPSRVKAFIPEHHGTSWVSYLYDLAVEQAGNAAEVDEAAFRHSGPKPQSKETALVMLADACEAAVRSARSAEEAEVVEIVDRMIAARVDDGQLDECDLTLRDVGQVHDVFVSSLIGVFHPRVKYPEPSLREASRERAGEA